MTRSRGHRHAAEIPRGRDMDLPNSRTQKERAEDIVLGSLCILGDYRLRPNMMQEVPRGEDKGQDKGDVPVLPESRYVRSGRW